MSTPPPKLKQLKLSPTQEKTALHFHLIFHRASHRPATIEFELTSHDAMGLLSALQSIQRRNGWRVPQFRDPKGPQRPPLRVVKKDD